MTVKIDNAEPNVFPAIEAVDARDSGRDAEVILATRIEGQLTPVTVKLSTDRPETCGSSWNRFGRTAQDWRGRSRSGSFATLKASLMTYAPEYQANEGRLVAAINTAA